jgi:cellulose synthase/poly-beta-1,6-N-acetylglucosamine synthase-like glycosyltransferase
MHMSQASGSFSVTVPAHRDEAVLEATVSGLCASDQPPVEVLVVVGSGDRVTREVAQRVADRHPELVEVVVEPGLFEVMAGEADRARGWPAALRDRVGGWAAAVLGRAARTVRDRVAGRAAPALGRAAQTARDRVAEQAAPALARAARTVRDHAAGRLAPARARAARTLRGGAPWAHSRGRRRALVGLLSSVAAMVAVAASVHASWVLYLSIGVSVLLGAIAWTTVPWMVNAWRTRVSVAEDRPDAVHASGSFSVTVPAHRDEAVLEAMLSGLCATDRPPVEVLVVVGSDDRPTREVAERVAARHPGLVDVVVDPALFDVMSGEVDHARGWPAAVRARVAGWAAPVPARAVRTIRRHAEGRTVPALARARRTLRVGARSARAFGLGHWRAAVCLLSVVAAGVVIAGAIHSASVLYLLYIGVSFALGAIAWTTLLWMVNAWRTPAALAESRLSGGDLEPAQSFSLIVPARHEEAVLETTLSRLARSDHPAFEVLVVVGTDDPATREVAERVASRYPDLIKVVLDSSWPKSKPKALNAALPYCNGTVTGVFDAEDDVHPALLRRVDQCFQRKDADVVQAGVQLMNFRSSWITVRNVLEYYFWFRSRLHFHARQGFIPLGGNTVFVRTQVLRAVSGWDPDCLAEDCELGVRLSALGARTVVFYEPELVTREECPPTLGAFARQRTRWNQGYLQTLSRGYWRRLPLRQRALGVYTLAMPYLMAAVWLTIPVAIATALVVKAPVPLTLISFLPALPMLSMLAVEIAGLGDFCRAYGERVSARDYGRLLVGLPVYQAVLAFAAARAVAREVRGDRGWEKTVHLGLHLAEQAGTERERADASPRMPARQRNGSHSVGAGTRLRNRWAVAPALSLAGTSGVVEAGADAGNGGPIVALRDEARAGDDLESVAGDVRRGGGNGHGEGPHHSTGDALGALGGDPLWVRLDAASTNGSPSVSLPHRGGAAGLHESWLGDLRARLSRTVASRGELLLLLGLLAIVGIVQATNLVHWPNTQFDEGTYVGNAWAVGHGALAPYTYSYGHPPLGWLFIALWTWARGIFVDGGFSIDTGRELMLVLTIISCSLLFTLARRLGMGRAFAAGAVLLFALSPLALFYHRAVLLDNVAIVWVLAAFVLARTPRRRLWAFAASGACFAASVLCKETTLVLLPALLFAAAQNTDKGTRRYCLTLFGSFLGLIALSYPLYATLKGELLPGSGHVSLVGYTIVQLFTREATGSIFDPNSQAHGIVTAWLKLDPWLVGSALVLCPIALARRSTRAISLAFLIQVAMVLRPGYLPNMYVIGFLPFAALIVAGASEALWRKARGMASAASAWPMGLALGSVAVAAALIVVPRWAHGDRVATTVRLDGPERAAQRWLVDHVRHDERLIVGDEFWIYLIEHGFDRQPMRGGFFSRNVVVYWPLDYDPAVKQRFPRGWREFDYVVSTQAVRSTTRLTPTTAGALRHSRLVVQYGRGDGRIEIRAITRPPTSG